MPFFGPEAGTRTGGGLSPMALSLDFARDFFRVSCFVMSLFRYQTLSAAETATLPEGQCHGADVG